MLKQTDKSPLPPEEIDSELTGTTGLIFGGGMPNDRMTILSHQDMVGYRSQLASLRTDFRTSAALKSAALGFDEDFSRSNLIQSVKQAPRIVVMQ